MNRNMKMTFVIATLGTVLAAAPALYAQDAPSGSAAPQSPGMMGHGAMTGAGMTGGDMSAMMKMMEDCNRMMQNMSLSPQNPSPTPRPPAAPRQ